MQYLISIADLKSRAERIGLSLPRLARAAGVAPSTAYRGLNGERDTGAKKVRAMMAALEAEERKCAEHLVKVGTGDEGRAA